MPNQKTPLGVTLIAILSGLLGLFLLLAALAVSTVVAFFFPVTGIATLFLGVMGLVGLAVAYGLWKGKSWAWYLSAIFWALSAIAALFGLNILGFIIDAAFVFYFLKSNVQSFFDVKIGWSWGK